MTPKEIADEREILAMAFFQAKFQLESEFKGNRAYHIMSRMESIVMMLVDSKHEAMQRDEQTQVVSN